MCVNFTVMMENQLFPCQPYRNIGTDSEAHEDRPVCAVFRLLRSVTSEHRNVVAANPELWKKVQLIWKKRLYCRTDHHYKHLEIMTSSIYKDYLKKQMYTFACIIMKEQWHNYCMKKDINKAEEFMEKTMKQHQHHLEGQLSDMARYGQTYILPPLLPDVNDKNIDKFIEDMDKILCALSQSSTAYEKCMSYYFLGFCLMQILKLDFDEVEHTGIYSKCVALFLNVKVGDVFRDKELDTVRELACNCFQSAVDMVNQANIARDYTTAHKMDPAYYDPTFIICPQLTKVKVLLDQPSRPECRKRPVCTRENVLVAEERLREIVTQCQEFEAKKLMPPRRRASLLLIQAELVYRKAAAELTIRRKQALAWIDQAIGYLSEYKTAIGSADYEEGRLATEFKRYLKEEFRPKLERMFQKRPSSEVKNDAKSAAKEDVQDAASCPLSSEADCSQVDTDSPVEFSTDCKSSQESDI